jgi:acyl-CoA-binding protein
VLPCIEKINIDQINFGSIEGKLEFDLSDPKRIEYTFVHLNQKDTSLLLNKTKYFIHGNKGTGKTSLIRFLHLKLKSQSNCTPFLILFKDAKEDPKIYGQIRKLMGNLSEEELDIASLTFWRWFILSLIAKEIFSYDQKYSVFFEKMDNTFYKLSKYLKDLINFALPIASIPLSGIEFSIKGFDEENENIEDIFEYAGVSIKYLEALLDRNLQQKVYILLDELDITINDTKQNKSLVKNIIPAANHLNKLNNVFVIASIRSEVLSAVFNGNEINKLMELYGVYMDWRDDKYDLSHPLMQMMLKKIKYSFITLCPHEEQSIENMSDSSIFQILFPTSLLKRGETQKNEQYILNTTWNKPRDIVRLFTIMSTAANGSKAFTEKHFTDAMDTYSVRAWEELSEEMTAKFSDDEIKMVENLFSNYQNCFTKKMFTLHAKQKKYQLSESETEELLSRLYEIGFLVNHSIEKQGRQIYKCSFRKDRSIDFSIPIEVHRGLWSAFPSMKDTRNEVLTNTEDETIFTTLGDKLRQFT